MNHNAPSEQSNSFSTQRDGEEIQVRYFVDTLLVSKDVYDAKDSTNYFHDVTTKPGSVIQTESHCFTSRTLYEYWGTTRGIPVAKSNQLDDRIRKISDSLGITSIVLGGGTPDSTLVAQYNTIVTSTYNSLFPAPSVPSYTGCKWYLDYSNGQASNGWGKRILLYQIKIKTMKKSISFLFGNMLLLQVCLSQQNFSLMFALADTQYAQTCYAAQTAQGFYLVGHYLTYSGMDGQITDFNSAFSVFKFNKTQQLEWKKDVHPQGDDEGLLQVFYQAPIKAIGGDLFMNYTYSEITPTDYLVSSAVLNYSDEGDLLWKQKFQGFVSSMSVQKLDSLKTIGVAYERYNSNFWPAYSITMDLDGNIVDTLLIRLPLSATYNRSYEHINYVTDTEKGLLFSCSFFDLAPPNYQVGQLLVALDHSGNIRWTKEFIYPDGYQSFDYHSSSKRILFAKGNYLNPNGPNSLTVESFDLDGNLVNGYYVPTQDIPYSYVLQVFAGNDASFFVLGQDNPDDNWLSKFSTDGALIWKRYIKETTLPNTFLSALNTGSIYFNGDILLSGFSTDTLNNTPVFENKVNYWVVQLSPDGCFNNDCNDTIKVVTTVLPTVMVKEQPTRGNFQVNCFPNPATNTLYWQISDGLSGTYTFKVYDLLGNTMIVGPSQHSNQGILNVDNLAKGWYIFTVLDMYGQPINSTKFQKN
ncbi:MAG: T9SS type A sorting domain-containing protein [Runella sp.]